MNYVSRPEYIKWLRRWKDKSVIKVVSGVRRCGKSTLLEMFRVELIKSGISPERIISINFEDIANESLMDYHALHDYIVKKHEDNTTSDDAKTYVFLDEIQHVEHFEKAIDSLLVRKDCDLYITGSNAYLLSTELATLLTGRYVELKMLPLSFREFCEGVYGLFEDGELVNFQPAEREEAFSQYLTKGSFPYVVELLNDEKTAREYIQDVYASILFKDIVRRMNTTDASLLERIAKVLASSVGSLVSINKITNTLKSSGRSADQKTVDKYINGLVESMLFYEAPRWDIKGRQLLSRISKYYIVDTGLRRSLIEGSSADLGHLLENVVYLELLRRNGNVYVGVLDAGEVDFVVPYDEGIEYYQVAASVMDSATMERELAPLRKIGDDHPKTLLTLDRMLAISNIDGIKVFNAIDWLLEN